MTCGFVEHLRGAARAIVFCDGPDAQSLSGILAHILLAMLYLLGLGRMDSRNAPAGDADENIAVPNANILDASERFLSAVLPLSMRAITHFCPTSPHPLVLQHVNFYS